MERNTEKGTPKDNKSGEKSLRIKNKIALLEKQLQEEISRRKKAEAKLSESETKFNALLQSVDDIVFTLDKEQRHTGMYGKVFEKNPGVREKFLGKTVSDIMDKKEAALHCEVNKRALGGESLVYEWEADMLGRHIHYSTMLSPIRDAEGSVTGIIGIGRDISSQKEIEQSLLNYNKKLAELNAEKDKFFSILSHDLRSPFYGLLGVSKELYSRIDSYSREEIKHFAFEIRNTLERVYRWLDSLLQWSRLQSGRISCRPAEVSLRDVVGYTLELSSAGLLQKRIQITNEVDKNIKVYADRNMLELILQNLLSNAIKFTYPDGKIVIRAEESETEVTVSVTDNGIGMSGEYMEKLFRVDSPFSTNGTLNEQGTGLGLILCGDMVLMNKGKIWAESRQGAGTTFYFTLPLP
ncbi:MAG TPA: PAS domain-containing sensor histidine kinase [Ignavibacteriales bacterium]|nr:PAS domain-containing sensor histidine kinase [Ignavibacteriales bacterium]